MNATPLVATLIAPTGAFLSEAQIQSVSQRITESGGIVTDTKILSNGQAADIFFSEGEKLILAQSRSIPSPLAGRVREWGGEATPMALSGSYNSFALLIQPTATRRKKILIADMESTLIEQEMLDEMAAAIGIGEKVADITRRAMNGELDFEAALKSRVKLLKGQPESLLHDVAGRITLMPGAETLILGMKKAGGRCWLVSGGFTFFVKKIADQLGFDRFFANDLMVENGVITGEVKTPILDKNSKKTLLEQACATYGCTLAECVAVGDGANDVQMLQACDAGGGLGIAFHAKPAVRAIIAPQINHADLTALIYAQGINL